MDTLLFKEGKLTTEDSKRHINYMFNLDDKCEKLSVSFAYEPKVLSDREKAHELIKESLMRYTDTDQKGLLDDWESFLPVQNLITISLYDPDGFRGAAHRHLSDQTLFLSENEASPGFIPGKLVPGQWEITISTHAVVTDVCNYRLHVWEGQDK